MRKYGMTLLASLAAAATLALAPAQATAATQMHQDYETQAVGANPGTGGSGGGGISLGVPTVTDAEANTGNQSASMTFNTGDASSTQANATLWSGAQSIPLDMKSVEIAVKMPAGNKFQFGLEETGVWAYRFGPAQEQTVDNGWEIHRINLGAMNLDPQRLANDGNNVGNMRFRLLGAADGGLQGQTGTLHVDTIQFTDQYGPFTAVTAVGYDNTTGPDWRDTSVAKPYDLDGDDVIGSDGFIVFEWNRRDVAGTDPDRNAANDLISLPTYIDEVQVGAGFNRASTDNWNGWTLNCPVSNANRIGGNILGAAWNWDNKDTVVVKRNGVTDSFTMTVFINHHVVTQQTFVYLGTPQPENLPAEYARIDNNQDGGIVPLQDLRDPRRRRGHRHPGLFTAQRHPGHRL